MKTHKVLLAISIAITAGISGCKSFQQTSEQAMYRAPGKRLLDESVDVGIPARLHWQYAWLSVASYNAIVDLPGEKEPLGSHTRAGPVSIELDEKLVTCEAPEKELWKAGWKRISPIWPAPSDEIYSVLQRTHTRVQVWENRDQRILAISFGGTDGRIDWRSNLRWFIPESEDEYSIVAKRVSQDFVNEFKKRAQQPENAYLRNMKLHATGHSLGGGLAQQFAYALPADPDGVVPRVSRVYAFDSSPVTGHGDVAETTLAANVEGMQIDRIYERGEILAAARAFTGLFLVPSSKNPSIRGVRYMFFWKSPIGAVSSHSMPRLACHLQHAKDRPIPPGQQFEED
ncbi:lipase family protein [Comamonas thiooxydans]|uniref:lipase family protein n=1 Tax=Comamonas thiooxydans TaxID=363952 RepID=UPI000F4ECFF0|nr:lipase family protein [Comamonas thiooxydans]MDO1475518.1 DUF2974 domain-containing protein [Comamonas thiooxydans]